MKNKTENPLNNWMILFSDCIQHMSKNDVNIILKNSTSIEVPGENVNTSGGFWDDSNILEPIFGCAIGYPVERWLQIFAHEYCHFLQFLDHDQCWLNFRSLRNEDTDKVFNNKPIEEWKLLQIIKFSKNIELDCEKRTVALLKKYKVPIDISTYIQKANVYIHFYNHIKTYRQWPPVDKVPYMIPSIIKTASTTFYKNYDEIPKAMLKEFEKHYPAKKKNNIIKES